MAEIRVMLKFDYPPPTGPESRHMWMLLNPDHLRTVTDLSDLIRSRYYPNQRGALCLYVHDCLLPPGESARLVRDNDVIRVQWQGYDPEDDDSDSRAHPTKKRSRQRCEEDDAGDRPTIVAKKRKCEAQPAETPRGREEMTFLEECEAEESSKSSRRKAKKKKVLERSPHEVFSEESSERSKHKKHSEDSASLKAIEKIVSLLGPNQEPSAKRGKASSSPHQEPSEVSVQPITTIPLHTPSPMTLRLFAALSVQNKPEKSVTNIPSEMSLEPIIPFPGKKPSHKSGKTTTSHSAKKPSEISPRLGDEPNHKPPDRISSSDSESSTDQKSSTKPKKPPKKLHKSRTVISVDNTKPNQKHPDKSRNQTSSSDSEPSTKQRKPPKKLHKSRTDVSVNKTKPNHEPPAESATKSSLGDSSESSSDHESSTKRKEPPKVQKKAGTVVSVNKTKPNHELPAKSATMSSLSDSSESSSDQDSSTKRKEPPKVQNKARTVVSVQKTNSNIDPSAMRTRSSIDYSASSYDQELSTARKNPSEATRNPSDPVSGRTVFSSEMRKSKNCASDNGDIRKRRSVDVGTVLPLNGTSQKPHKETPSSGSESDTNIIQEPVAARDPSSVVPSCVTNGGGTGGIHQGPEPNPGLYDHGRGRGRGIFPWRGQGGRGFRGRGDRGKGRGFGNQFFHSYDSPSLKKQQLEEVATNTSVIIQNPPERPKKDYSTFPLLAAPPQVGRVIAFKILELDENFSPELSDYKEGVVRSVDPVTQQIEVELLSKQKRREPGKFDLVYEMEDGREVVEFAVPPDCQIRESWSSLITPRLVMEKGSEEGTSLQPL